MIRNRRQHRRDEIRDLVQCRREGAVFEGVIGNISAGGAFFVGYRAPEPGEFLEVLFANKRSSPIEILAQVVHVVPPMRDRDAGYGVRWVEAVCDGGAKPLRKFLRRRFDIRDALAVVARRGGPASFAFPEPVTVDPTSFDERVDRTVAAQSEQMMRVVQLVRSGVSLDRATKQAFVDEPDPSAVEHFHEKSTAVVRDDQRGAMTPRRSTRFRPASGPQAAVERGFVGAGRVDGAPRTMPAMSPLMPVGASPRNVERPAHRFDEARTAQVRQHPPPAPGEHNATAKAPRPAHQPSRAEDSDVPFGAPLATEAIAELPTMTARRDQALVPPPSPENPRDSRRNRRRRIRPPRAAPQAPAPPTPPRAARATDTPSVRDQLKRLARGLIDVTESHPELDLDDVLDETVRTRKRVQRPSTPAPSAPNARLSREELVRASTSDLIRRQVADAQTHQVRHDGDVAGAREKKAARRPNAKLGARDQFEVPLDPETQRQSVEDLLASADRLFVRRPTEHKPLPEDLEEARRKGLIEGTQTLGSSADQLRDDITKRRGNG